MSKKASVSIDGNVLTWEFANGSSHKVDAGRLPDAIQDMALVHGIKQKLSDVYAGAESAREAEEKFLALLDQLEDGNWNAGRSSTGGIWVEALAKASGQPMEKALEVWNQKSADERQDIQKHPQVKQAKAEIELERAKAKAKGTELDLSEI